MQLRCVVYSISQAKIINYDYFVETTELPIIGLDPDLKIYGEYYTNQEPLYDSRGWILDITSTLVDSPHPGINCSSLFTYEKTYSVIRCTNEELKISVDNMESWANNLLLPETVAKGKEQRLLRIIRKEAKGQHLNTKEQELADEMDNIQNAIDENSSNKDNMYDYIEDNPTLVPDFDEGWITIIE